MAKRKIQAEDFLGKKFSKLLVVKVLPEEGYNRFVECICDCGNSTKVNIFHLKNKHTRSCGCFQRQKAKKVIKTTIAKKLPNGESPKHSAFSKYLYSAKKRNIPFEITKEDFIELCVQPCYYCGDNPSLVFTNRRYKEDTFTHNGIDRKDNELGYVKENCVPCCSFCNYAKKTSDIKFFLNKIKKIYFKHYV